MQDISLEYLGKYARDDPRQYNHPPWRPPGGGSEQRLWNPAREATGSNVWSDLKFHVFPTGWRLALTLVGFAAFSAWRLRVPGPGGGLALAGLLCTLASSADLAVAMLGEGRHELIKHLYFANLLFDLAAIACLNGALVWWREHTVPRHAPPRQITSANACLTRMNTV